MSRGPQQPYWWRVVEAIEDHIDLEARNRADGVLTPEEDEAERRHIRLVVLGLAVDSADALSIAQAVARGGPESGHAARLLRDRARRLADPAPFPGDRFGLGDGDAVQLAEAA